MLNRMRFMIRPFVSPCNFGPHIQESAILQASVNHRNWRSFRACRI
jgi:hypothetical protein